MKIAILYSHVESKENGDDLDLIAEQDILQSVASMEILLKDMHFDVVKVRFSKNMYEDLRNIAPDFVINLCDSFEDSSKLEGTVPAVLELLKIPYSGGSLLPVSVCLDKARAKELLLAHGLPTPRFQLIDNQDFELEIKLPVIVKPNFEDASIGIRRGCVVFDMASLKERVKLVLETYNQPVIIEEFIEGREFDVCLIGNNDPIVFPVSESVFKNYSKDEIKICDYESKWVEDDKHYNDIVSEYPAKISKELERKLVDISKKAYKVVRMHGYARIELRVRDNEPYIIEVNQNPDISVGYLFFKLAKYIGIEKEELITKLINYGLERAGKKLI
ncbi:MAG: ATP-grasp domain-containing protein [archaeon]